MDPLEIGHVIGVSGDTIEVQISVADLKLTYHGKTYRIGRLGTYVTLPMERRTLIGYITRVGYSGDLEPGPNPPAPRRITLVCQLLGTVQGDRFTRGVNEYPTLGDVVRLGVDEDFGLIFGSFDEMSGGEAGHPSSFSMGRFAIDTDFEVRVLGREFFAKHVVVMGNSGSGKSCTTAKIVHEVLRLRHAQIVLFDIHGEYLRAFSDDYGSPLPNVTYLSDRNLVLPYWLLAFEEFEQLFVDRNNPLHVNAQKLFLRDAFDKLKLAAAEELGLRWEYTVDTPIYYSIDHLLTYATNMNNARYVLNTQNYAFARLPFRQLPPAEQERLLLTRRMEFNPATAEGEVPHATYAGRLLGLINMLEARLNDRRYDFLLKPFQQARHNMDLAGKFCEDATPGQISQAVAWVLRQMLGQIEERKNLTIVDLSGLPFDVVDTTVAVLTRALFDFNFWSPPQTRQPVLLIYEEAHNYLPRKPSEGRRTFARDAVEKVAKEGRKYGVCAMIVSQRPCEISESILSQCNTMILMRMNNPDDQEYVARVVSDQFGSLVGLLPSLRPGEGFIIGDSVLMPMRTLIDRPPREPQSANIDFFQQWACGTAGSTVEQVVQRWWRQERSTLQVVHSRSDPSDSDHTPPASDQSRGTDGSFAAATNRFVPEDETADTALAESCPAAAPARCAPLSPHLPAGRSSAAAETSASAAGAQAVGSGTQPAAELAQPNEMAADSGPRPSRAEQKLAEFAAWLSGRCSPPSH